MCKNVVESSGDLIITKSTNTVACGTVSQSNIQSNSALGVYSVVTRPETHKRVFGRYFYNSNVNKRDVKASWSEVHVKQKSKGL